MRGHGYWRDLIEGKVDSNEINYNQTTTMSAEKSFVNACDNNKRKAFGVPKKPKVEAAAQIPERYSEWFFVENGKVLPNDGAGV